MARVTSKLQVTVPKAIADEYGIRPGDDMRWIPAGDAIRVLTSGRKEAARTAAERVELFDAATERQRARNAEWELASRRPRRAEERGWARDELYGRGRPR